MKEKKRKNIKAESNEIMPLLVKVWRRLRKLSGPTDRLQTREFRNVAAALKKRKTGEILSEDAALDVSLLYDWIIYYQQALSIFGELPKRPKRVLDLSGGLAYFSFAALRHDVDDVVLMSMDHRQMQIGAEICGFYGYTLATQGIPNLSSQLPYEGKADVICLGHCLYKRFGNISDFTEVVGYLKGLLTYLSPKGCVVIIEPSEAHYNTWVLQLRDQLVSEGFPIQAPCVWKGKCPALQAKNHCYAQREFEKPYIIQELQRASDIFLNSLKMSYLILRHPDFDWPSLPPRAYYRIISPPFESIRGKTYYLCGVKGKKKLSSSVNDHPKSLRPFDYVKRGELVEIKNAFETEYNFELKEESELEIAAALGKPIPEMEENND
ncbi:MAG: hypothetical protein Tsb0021_10390 [Chlamydiales bacterium]